MMNKNEKKNKKSEDTLKAETIQDTIEKGENKDKDEVAHLESKIEELENQVKRIFADYQNLEKRVASERREWLIKANKDLILRFLPALDFLLLSSNHIDDEGLKLSIQNFFDILKAEGVEKIEAVGLDFDPNKMEAIKTVGGKENRIVEELRTGYIMGDIVLRPSQVIVGSAKQNQEEIN
jgi:molecular chaperone GrpE